MSDYLQQNYTVNNFSDSNNWVLLNSIESSIKEKIENNGVPLGEWDIAINYGIKTGYNDAFIIDEATKNTLIAADPKSAELIRPILRGKDIKRYTYDFAKLWIILVPCGFTNKNRNGVNPEIWFKSTYTSIYSYLVNTEAELSKTRSKKSKGVYKRDDQGDYWWELRSCKYLDDFNKQKIIYPNMTKYLPFFLDDKGFFTNQKCFIITGEHLFYLTAFLNSKLFKFCFRESFPQLQGGTRELSKIFFEKIKVKKINDFSESHFINIVKEIQDNKLSGLDTHLLEQKIDEMLMELYPLTEKEKETIRSFSL